MSKLHEAKHHVNVRLDMDGYNGKLDNVGLFEGVAVYALYDESRISYSEIIAKLKEEAKQQCN